MLATHTNVLLLSECPEIKAMMRFKTTIALLAAALNVVGFSVQAQDIKLGFNGDLSASPSAQSGQAAVLGLQAAMDRNPLVKLVFLRPVLTQWRCSQQVSI